MPRQTTSALGLSNLGRCGTDFNSTSCMVSSASSRWPQTRMLKENTVFWSRARACSSAASSSRCNSRTACSISERIDLNVALRY